MQLVNVIDLVKVKQGLATEIKQIVTNEGFYTRGTREDKFDRLNDLKTIIFEMYNLEGVEDCMVVDVDEHEMQSNIQYGAYDAESGNIVIRRISMITFLTSIREVMYLKGIQPQINDKNIDKKAWACRAFQLACPKSFKKSVKAGNVIKFIWDDESNKAMMKLNDTTAEML